MRDSRKIYFARCIGPTGEPIGAVKVGCSYDLEVRLSGIAQNSPFTLELIATFKGDMFLEAFVHLLLREHKIGGEYFHENDAVLKVIEDATKGTGIFKMVRDNGNPEWTEGVLDRFMRFHGVPLKAISSILDRPEKVIGERIASQKYKSRTIAAAISLVAISRGRKVNWPDDARIVPEPVQVAA